MAEWDALSALVPASPRRVEPLVDDALAKGVGDPMLESYLHHHPQVDPSCFVHASAVVSGDVRLGPRVSVWPGTVLRGDQGSIVVGEDSNLQDGTIAHATGGRSTVVVGRRVTVGHRALLHGCVVEDHCLVGMGAILLDNCVVGEGSIVGAGSLLPVGKRFPGGKLILGSPARVVRDLTDEDRGWIEHSVETYLRLAEEHRLACAEGGPKTG